MYMYIQVFVPLEIYLETQFTRSVVKVNLHVFSKGFKLNYYSLSVNTPLKVILHPQC